MGFCVGSLFWGVVIGTFSSLASFLLEKRKLVAYFNCIVAVCGLCFFPTVLRVGLQSVIVALSGHTTNYDEFPIITIICNNFTSTYISSPKSKGHFISFFS